MVGFLPLAMSNQCQRAGLPSSGSQNAVGLRSTARTSAPLFAFAGIYRQWKGPVKKDGPNVDIEVFSFMTTLPNTLTMTIKMACSTKVCSRG